MTASDSLISRLEAAEAGSRERLREAHGEMEMAVERADTALRLMNDGRTELGAISDVWGAHMDRRDKFTADLRLILNALRAALTQGESPQAGWRLVPVEPTDEMMEAGYAAIERNNLRDAWEAMIAAPTPAETSTTPPSP